MTAAVRSLPTGSELGPLSVPARLAQADMFSVASQSSARRLPAGAILSPAAEGGNFVYLILTGSVRVSQRTLGRREVALGTLGSGQVFGLGALIDSQEDFTAQATEDVELGVVDPATFLAMVRSHPTALSGLLGQVGAQLVQVEQQLGRANHVPTAARLARLLYRLAMDLGERGDGQAVSVPPGWTSTALARQIGCSRETVSRLLTAFQHQGWIRRDQRRIEIPDPPDFAAWFDIVEGEECPVAPYRRRA